MTGDEISTAEVLHWSPVVLSAGNKIVTLFQGNQRFDSYRGNFFRTLAVTGDVFALAADVFLSDIN